MGCRFNVSEGRSAHQPALWGDQPPAITTATPQVQWLDSHSWVSHVPGWMLGADRLLQSLRAEQGWRGGTRQMYDRQVTVPRLWCRVDCGELPRDHPIRMLHAALDQPSVPFASEVGVNLYRTGADSVAWHGDRVGRDRAASTVALVSLGGPRALHLRPATRERQRSSLAAPGARRYHLHSGDLLVMGGACQQDWEHSVPKQRHAPVRISLAFRSSLAVSPEFFLHSSNTRNISH